MDMLGTKPLSKESKPAGKGSRFPRRALFTTAAAAGIAGGVVVALHAWFLR